MKIPHQLCVVTSLRFVKIGCQRLDSTSSDDHIRFVPQNIETLEPFFRSPCQFKIQNYTVAPRLVRYAPLELLKGVNRYLSAIGELAFHYIAGFALGYLGSICIGETLRI